MKIELEKSTVRCLHREDAAAIAVHANDPLVAANLRDSFPCPYLPRHAEQFIAAALAERPRQHYAIEVEGQAIGVIGLRRLADDRRYTAELGYWIGRAYWGQGIMSEVLPAVVAYVVCHYKLVRLEALVHRGNTISERLLRKAGFRHEGTCLKSAIKAGRMIDRELYAYVAAAASAGGLAARDRSGEGRASSRIRAFND